MAIEIGVYGGVIPAAIALAVAYLCRKVLPGTMRDQYAAAVGMAAAFFAGYVLLPSWAELEPTRHWQWLPYLGIVAAVLGPVGASRNALVPLRLTILLILSILAAWFLVPSWPRLQPVRYFWMAGLAIYLFVLNTALDSLTLRLAAGRFLAGAFVLASASTAAVVGYSVSAKHGQVAGIVTAALFGCWPAILMFQPVQFVRGLLPVYAITVGGVAFTGCIEPDPPSYILLILPTAPIVLWAFAVGPLSKLRGVPAAAAQLVALLLSLAAVAAWILLIPE